jgi:hypothetical protein
MNTPQTSFPRPRPEIHPEIFRTLLLILFSPPRFGIASCTSLARQGFDLPFLRDTRSFTSLDERMDIQCIHL